MQIEINTQNLIYFLRKTVTLRGNTGGLPITQ